MPTYEYACKSCGEHLEAVQAFSDEPLTECPACGGVLRKVFGSIGIAFKGSGFYKTDSRNGGKGSATVPSSSSEGGGGGGEKKAESAGGDSKSDTPATPAPAKESKAPASSPSSTAASAAS